MPAKNVIAHVPRPWKKRYPQTVTISCTFDLHRFYVQVRGGGGEGSVTFHAQCYLVETGRPVSAYCYIFSSTVIRFEHSLQNSPSRRRTCACIVILLSVMQVSSVSSILFNLYQTSPRPVEYLASLATRFTSKSIGEQI